MAMKVTYTVVNGEVLSENRNGVIRDYVPDSLGSTIALLDNAQTITDTFEYWPYGEVRTRTGTTATPFQFVGTLGYYTDASGRAYVRARYLRMDTTRWLTEDPIGFSNGEFNHFQYSKCEPVRWNDPSGLKVKFCYRPVVGNCFLTNGESQSHWFLDSSICGCVGWGPKGIIWGCAANLGDYNTGDVTCIDQPYTLAQEKCMCDNAKNADNNKGKGSGRGWILCGKNWNGGKYDFIGNNCQDFVECLVTKCTGKGTGRCHLGDILQGHGDTIYF